MTGQVRDRGFNYQQDEYLYFLRQSVIYLQYEHNDLYAYVSIVFFEAYVLLMAVDVYKKHQI